MSWLAIFSTMTSTYTHLHSVVCTETHEFSAVLFLSTVTMAWQIYPTGKNHKTLWLTGFLSLSVVVQLKHWAKAGAALASADAQSTEKFLVPALGAPCTDKNLALLFVLWLLVLGSQLPARKDHPQLCNGLNELRSVLGYSIKVCPCLLIQEDKQLFSFPFKQQTQ